jgi:hypothetical protein
MGDSVPQHTGPNSLIDTLPRTERLRNPTDHHQQETPAMERPLPQRNAQATCRCTCWASKSTPFFQIVNVIAAIFRAKVSRAMSGRIPLASRAL